MGKIQESAVLSNEPDTRTLITGDDSKSIKMRVIDRIEKAVAKDIEEFESL